MSRVRDDANIPRYKSHRYTTTLSVEWAERDRIDVFRKNGELTEESYVLIHKNSSYSTALRVEWDRRTQEGNERILLGFLYPTEYLLEFLDIYFMKKDFFFARIFLGTRWLIPFGLLRAAIRTAETNPEYFKEIVRTAESPENFMALTGVTLDE